MKQYLIHLSVQHPKRVFWITGILSLLALLMLPFIHIDTDPENMLPPSHPARVAHHDIKERFGLSDMIVVGIVNEQSPSGIYTPATLSKLQRLTAAIAAMDGVLPEDVMSLATADNIRQHSPSHIDFDWLMAAAPSSLTAASELAVDIQRLPLLQNTLVSQNGLAAGIYVPIEKKSLSYGIYQHILTEIQQLPEGDEQYHITGLPVAEDTFGVEMFQQMAISAPAAGALIFVLLLFFFRSLPLVAAPMLVAMATVIITMGLMIGLGFPVHIMSSMIAIFLMPIAVVDSVHILSEFSDHYRAHAHRTDKIELIQTVVNKLYQPMLFTSITSAVGFISLNTADIPPVRVFGSFIGVGIAIAFLLSITLIPAYIACLSDQTLNTMALRLKDSQGKPSHLTRWLPKIPALTLHHRPIILSTTVIIFALSGWGMSHIVINDNPMNWFEKDHPIRQADNELNQHFAGTYEAFLTFSYKSPSSSLKAVTDDISASQTNKAIKQSWQALLAKHSTLTALTNAVIEQQFTADEDSQAHWDSIAQRLEALNTRPFLQPENLAYIEGLQQVLQASGLVGKSNGLPDLLKTLNRELVSGEEKDYRLPHSAEANAQALLAFQGSHRPNDVWHMVTPDYHSTVLWLQLTSGDNQDMNKVINLVHEWMIDHPLPEGMTTEWGGLTYLNVLWQEAMVSGMLNSLLSSFVMVALMMMVLFRSVLWGLLAMLPLSVSITLIYGVIGFLGKDYDMPVAVLSALTLGLSVDFAIHFLTRARASIKEHDNLSEGLSAVFGAPCRAISRNAIVIALGFTPLLFAPLIPYQTVGVLLAAIMIISCLATFLILPAALSCFRSTLFGLRHPINKTVLTTDTALTTRKENSQ